MFFHFFLLFVVAFCCPWRLFGGVLLKHSPENFTMAACDPWSTGRLAALAVLANLPAICGEFNLIFI